MCVTPAGDGCEALKLVSTHPGNIHLLLTDMVMPRMNGTELASSLSGSRPILRVLYMTGYAEFSHVNADRMSTEASVVQKPVSKLTLLEKVREALGSEPCQLPSGTKV